MSEAVKKAAPYSGVIAIGEDEYNSHPAERNSNLGYLLRSPAHYWNAINSPKVKKDCFEFGTAAHAGILEPKKFYSRYRSLPEGNDRRTKAGKEAHEAIVSQGLIPLKADEFQAIERMIEAVYSHPVASKYLSGGVVEHAYFWTDPATGIQCKAKPDYLRTDNIYIDLKTTDDASSEAFQRSTMKWGYPRQSAFYQDGLKAATGRDLAGTIFLAVEYNAPYGIGVYMPDDLMVEYGRQQYTQALGILSECLKKNEFPSYETSTQVLTLPGWVK